MWNGYFNHVINCYICLAATLPLTSPGDLTWGIWMFTRNWISSSWWGWKVVIWSWITISWCGPRYKWRVDLILRSAVLKDLPFKVETHIIKACIHSNEGLGGTIELRPFNIKDPLLISLLFQLSTKFYMLNIFMVEFE